MFLRLSIPGEASSFMFCGCRSSQGSQGSQGYRTNGIFISQSLLYIFQPGGIMTWQAGGQDGTLTDLLK